MPSSSETAPLPTQQRMNNNPEGAPGIEEKVEAILTKYGSKKSSLISILLEVQSEYNYLPKTALEMIAQKLGIQLIQVYTVATFYKVFSLKPRGKHIINVCMGTACHVRGGSRIVDEVSRQLNIADGETTQDMLFTLETVRCLGTCALGPVLVIDGEYYGQMNAKKVTKLLNTYKPAEASA